MVAPPPDTGASLATQAAAQQMWEQATAPDSDNTSTSLPSESPPAPRSALDITILQNMLNSLQGSAGTLNPMQVGPIPSPTRHTQFWSTDCNALGSLSFTVGGSEHDTSALQLKANLLHLLCPLLHADHGPHMQG